MCQQRALLHSIWDSQGEKATLAAPGGVFWPSFPTLAGRVGSSVPLDSERGADPKAYEESEGTEVDL